MADILKPGTVDNGFKFIGGDPSSPTSWEPEGLKIGTVDEGYRFLGGDPASKDSWSKMDRSYIGAAAESGGRALLAAGAKLVEEFNPFTTSEQDAAVLFKDNPEKLKAFTEKSAASVLSRFAQEQTRRAEEAMKDVTPTEKGLISGRQLGELEYATLDPEKAAYLSPTRVAGDVLQSLPTTLALAVSGYLTKGRSIAAFETAEANALARGVAATEAKQVARQEAIKVAADTMAKTGAVGEGALGYAMQANQALAEAKALPDEQWDKSPEFRNLVDKEGYSPESAKILLANKAAEEAGVFAGTVDAATNLVGGKILGKVIGEGGKLGARAAKGFATEAATETIQSAGEQLGANVAMQRVTPELDLTKGVLESAVAGGVVGGVTGGGVSAVFGSRQRPETDILNDLNNAKDVGTATAVANELAGSIDTLTAATTEYLAPPPAAKLTPDESLELAAAKGAMERVGPLDLGAGPSVVAPASDLKAAADVALRGVEANQGIATPAQAAIIDAAFPGRKMYDSVAVGGAVPAPAGGVIEVPATTVPRETFKQGAAEAASAEGFAELQARQQAATAAAPTPAAPVAPAPPVANTVIQAFATPAFQRTPEQRVTLSTAQQAYPAEDMEVMQLAATAPFRLDANQKVRLQALRQPQLSTTRPEGVQPAVFPPTASPMGTVPETAAVEQPAVPAFTAPGMAPTVAPVETVTTPPLQQQEQPTGTAPAPQTPLPTPTVDSAFVAQMASTPELTFTPEQVRVVDPNELQGTARQTARLITQIGRVFGKQVVMFDGLQDIGADGFVNPQARDTIFLNTKSTKPHLNVFGHELFHLVKQDSPEIYRAFASVVERNLDEQGRAAFKADYGTGANIEEISSDLIGNRFSDPTFWTDVFNEVTQTQPTQKAQGVVARLAGTLFAAVDRLVGAVRGQGFKADEFVKDLQSIKTAARSAMVEYAKVRKIPAMQMEAEIAKTKQLVTQRIQGEQNARPIQSAARPNRPELGEDRGGAIPSYGEAREGAVSAEGIHYSQKQRTELDSEFYGGGLTGVEKGRVYSAQDKRLRNRIYFYADEGNGIKPELGVGDFQHRVQLNNLYDPATKLIPAQPNANAFESAVLDAGFDGYINRNFEGQGAIVLLGERKVPVAAMGKVAPRFSAARPAEFNIKANKDGSITVRGDAEQIRASIPEGIVGRQTKDGLVFTRVAAPRVQAALEGRQVAYSRAGETLAKRPIKDGKYIGAPEKYNTPGKLPKLVKQLRQLTQEGAAGRYWYENSGKEVLKMVGGDVNEARKFVALLAIYSPQAKVDANTTFALRAWAQYKAGQPISVKTGVMDDKAQQALDNVDAFWSGEKTGNFFFNLLREIDPTTAGKQGATIDMWMMRAGEYNNDAPTSSQYAFMENETNLIAQELGWEPQQVQAAIWVAMKARMENPGVKKNTEATSEKKGWIRYDYPIKNGKPIKTRVILDAQKHRDNWLKHAMDHDPTKDDTQLAKFDFGDGLKRHLGQLSFEARPGRSTEILPGIHDATYEQQMEFQRDVQNALLEEDGSDRLAQLLGLMVDTNDINVPGVWQGDVSPSSQKLLAMAPAKGTEGKSNVDPAQAEMLDVYSAIRGLLAYQEGVGWHRPFFAGTKRDANGLDIDLGRGIYPEEVKALEGAVGDWMQANGKGADWADSFAFISSPTGVRLVSFGIIENGQLHSDIVSVAESVLPDFDYRVFASSGNLVSNNWKENPNGESYIQRASAAGRSDVLDWARDVLAPRVQSVFKDYSRKYGWGNPGSFNFAAERGAAGQGQPKLSRRRGLESIFEGLNGKGLTLTRAEAAAKQHPAAAEIAYVQDNFYDILSELEDSGLVTINCD